MFEHLLTCGIWITVVDCRINHPVIREGPFEFNPAGKLAHAGQQSAMHNAKQKMTNPVPGGTENALVKGHIRSQPLLRGLAVLEVLDCFSESNQILCRCSF